MKVKWSANFEDLYKQRGQQKHGIRLLALWKIQSGITETKVCEMLGKTHATIRQWRHLYESGGVEALLSISPGRGRKSKLTDKQVIEQILEAHNEEQKGGRIRCQDVLDMMAAKYNIVYSQPGMYKTLHRLGFSWITARSKHPKQDQESQEEFKKKFHAKSEGSSSG
jgi:transposase